MIHKIKSWFFEKGNALAKHLVKYHEKKQEREGTGKQHFNVKWDTTIEIDFLKTTVTDTVK